MSSKKWTGSGVKQRLTDIVNAVQHIEDFINGFNEQRFLRDAKTQSAVEYQLLTISEACARILDLREDVRSRFPDVQWTAIRAMANVLRHEYGRVDPNVIWDTVQPGGDLYALASAVRTLLEDED